MSAQNRCPREVEAIRYQSSCSRSYSTLGSYCVEESNELLMASHSAEQHSYDTTLLDTYYFPFQFLDYVFEFLSV